MQYFLDKLKEFLVFLVFSRLVQGVAGTLQSNQEDHSKVKRKFKFSSWLCSTPAVRPYTIPGERMKVNARRTVVGGWLATVSPPTVERDRRACTDRQTDIARVCVQRVQIIRSSVPVTECVFRRVNCVMATHSAGTTAMRATALASTVSTGMKITLCSLSVTVLCNYELIAIVRNVEKAHNVSLSIQPRL